MEYPRLGRSEKHDFIHSLNVEYFSFPVNPRGIFVCVSNRIVDAKLFTTVNTSARYLRDTKTTGNNNSARRCFESYSIIWLNYGKLNYDVITA